jgi:hypothetical protein
MFHLFLDASEKQREFCIKKRTSGIMHRFRRVNPRKPLDGFQPAGIAVLYMLASRKSPAAGGHIRAARSY